MSTADRWALPIAGALRKGAGGASPPAAEAALLRFARSFFRGGESA